MDPQQIAASFSRVRTSEYLEVEENWQKLKKYIDDYEAVKCSVASLSEKSKHHVMVPFGNVAFMTGSLVHTNDVLVLLGDNWFVEQSAKQTVDILNRRVAALQTQADRLQTRLQQIKTELSYAQRLAEESGDTVEIVEVYDEQTEQSWKTQHHANMRKYRQEMKELNALDVNNLSRTGSTEYQQIWRRLEQLEEEEEGNDDDDVDDDKANVGLHRELDQQEPLSDAESDTREHHQALVINFHHSVTGSQIRERSATLCSPADIYDRFCLHPSSTTSRVDAMNVDHLGETQLSQSRVFSSETLDSQSLVEAEVATCHDSEMMRTSVATDPHSSAGEPVVRKVSKFKASRLQK